MQMYLSKQMLEELQKEYPAGTRVELISIGDPDTCLKPGDRGTVEFVDDTGTIFVKWDCGSSLGLVYGVDNCRKIKVE